MIKTTITMELALNCKIWKEICTKIELLSIGDHDSYFSAFDFLHIYNINKMHDFSQKPHHNFFETLAKATQTLIIFN